MMDKIRDWLTSNSDRFESELMTFLRIPSISALPEHQPDMVSAANFVKDQLEAAGCEATIHETEGFPIVTGRCHVSDDAPTALVYGHYDVQPSAPDDLWTTPPFEPTVRDGKVYARGATDDKGQMFTHIKSVEAWNKNGGLPMNVQFVIEGEEEVGSENLDRFLEEHRTELACDVAVISDTSQYQPDLPAITYGLRGILAAEVTVTGPNSDLHSGVFGGAVTNPINALTFMLGGLIDEHGTIQIPGFYDDVVPLSDAERQAFADLPFDESAFRDALGVSAVNGEDGFSTLERRWARPTCDINGIHGGWTGTGPKTIIPSKASAKITCRLVASQDPDQLTKALETFLRDRLPAGVEMEFEPYHGCSGLVFDPNSPHMDAAKVAIESAFGVEPVLIREGGSIPVVSSFQQILSAETLLLGWGLNTDNLHAPDEHFTLKDFHRGIAASAALWQELSQVSSS